LVNKIKQFITEFFQKNVVKEEVELTEKEKVETVIQLVEKEQLVVETVQETDVQKYLRNLENEFQEAFIWLNEIDPTFQSTESRKEILNLYTFFSSIKKDYEEKNDQKVSLESTMKIRSLMDFKQLLENSLFKAKMYDQKVKDFKKNITLRQKRDPISERLFHLLMLQPFMTTLSNDRINLKRARLRITFALLYFTGSKIFNTLVRQKANDLGFTLNEHALSHLKDGLKGNPVEEELLTEESILNFLGSCVSNLRTGSSKIVLCDPLG
jgi:hypothetical protein